MGLLFFVNDLYAFAAFNCIEDIDSISRLTLAISWLGTNTFMDLKFTLKESWFALSMK